MRTHLVVDPLGPVTTPPSVTHTTITCLPWSMVATFGKLVPGPVRTFTPSVTLNGPAGGMAGTVDTRTVDDVGAAEWSLEPLNVAYARAQMPTPIPTNTSVPTARRTRRRRARLARLVWSSD